MCEIYRFRSVFRVAVTVFEMSKPTFQPVSVPFHHYPDVLGLFQCYVLSAPCLVIRLLDFIMKDFRAWILLVKV